MLISYLRNRHGHRNGVVVSVGRNQIGFSLCCPKDRWNKELGKKIAIGRAHTFLPIEDWEVNLIHQNNKDQEITISFTDWIEGNYPDGYIKPAFKFNGQDIFHVLKSELVFKICQMYDRSRKYFKT